MSATTGSIASMHSAAVVEEKVKGLKKLVDKSKWKRNTAKVNRASGKQYVATTGTVLAKKKFQRVHNCCNKQCCKHETIGEQKSLFHNFLSMADKGQQDMYLATILIPIEPKERTAKPKNIPRILNWKYEVIHLERKHSVCKQSVIELFQCGPKRLRTIQQICVPGHHLYLLI
ncbi:hypothetical protein ANN_00016 [Periplaneta americana]|uniref:Uncharacterized protein n=1 Tax=Periplaneta americana TaxID=6978 RepID=A0ABQ8TR75_PERAM|nr:hypothetical protein ANN_00016 [Periplaneta americana]